MLGLEQLSPEDRNVVVRARRLERFLTQPFFTTEQFTGLKGKLVSLKDALDGCERILHDEFKDYPERALYMIGPIGEAKKASPPDKPAVKAQPGGKPATNVNPKPAADSKPEAKSEPKASVDAKPETNGDGKPDARAQPKQKSTSDAKPNVEPKPVIALPAENKSEPQPQPQPEPAANTHES